MNAQRPTMDTIQTISFPPDDILTMKITALAIEISEDTIASLLNELRG